MKNTFFDATPYAARLNPVFAPDQTHFTFLEDSEINGAPGQRWLTQVGENLHVTIQSDDNPRSKVAHYFYNRKTNEWRCHLKNNQTPIPYGTHVDANLLIIQQKAVEFAWPVAAIIMVEKGSKKAKLTKGQKKQRFQDAKKTGKFSLDDVYEKKRAMPPGSLKPVRFQPPPDGMITEDYIKNLIDTRSEDSLEYIYRSDDWPLHKWEAPAWSAMLWWLVSL